MDHASQRRLIAQRSSIQRELDARPRCQDCGRVLIQRDYRSYWDGGDPHVEGCIPRGESVVPRCCEHCAEEMGRKSV